MFSMKQHPLRFGKTCGLGKAYGLGKACIQALEDIFGGLKA